MKNLQQHPLATALIIAILVMLCYQIVAWLPTWQCCLLLVGILAGTPLWWRAYKAIASHVQDNKDREAYRALLSAATDQARAGYNLELVNPANGTTLKLSNPFAAVQRAHQQQQLPNGQQQPQQQTELPTYVRYEDVRGQVPAGHILVGIGKDGIETKEKAVGACLWIVGLSGTGKTSTTVIRVEERATDGHKILGVDPHWFKDDSLYHSIYEDLEGQPGAYKDLFIKPMARSTEEAKAILQAFIDEFNGRKGGRIAKPWGKITLLVDEVGALVDTISEEEEEVAKMLKYVARICGQEARNFMMGGVFISQQATGLAWLRKMALMVIVHQLLMQSEKELACNGDKAAAKDMETWPIGRTYVFGVGFQEGPRTVQQPYFAVPKNSDKVFHAGDSLVTGPLSYSCTPITTPLVEPVPDTVESPERVPALGPDDMRFTPEQEQEFLRRWQKQRGPVKPVLRQMNNGLGLSNRYAKYASWLLAKRGMRE